MTTKRVGAMTIWLMSAATAGPALADQAGQNPARREAVSDSGVTAKIKADLMASEMTRVGDVSVKTNNGVVTLTGSVPDEDALKQVLSVASSAKGVTRVENDLTIAPKQR